MATILVVDDHSLNREFLVTLLGYEKHRLLEASDGAEALALVRAEFPDLVITDILMPTMDGYEFVHQLRSDPSIAGTAVIFYTARYRKHEALSLAKSCGVRHILAKPCEPDLILRSVGEVLASPLRLIAQTPGNFNDQHIRVITDKLSYTTDELTLVNQRLDALIEIGLHLASERDPYRLLETMCRASRDLVGAKYGFVAIDQKDNRDKGYFVTCGMDAATSRNLSRPVMNDGVLRSAYLERRALRLSNPSGDPQLVGLPASYPPVFSLLVAPIVSLAHAYGWICLIDKIGAQEFSSEDNRLLSILAAQVGRIYENGSLYYEIQSRATQLETEVAERKRAEQKVQRMNRLYAMLSGINSLIVRVDDRQELFNEACRAAVKYGGFAVARIGLVDPGTLDVNTLALSSIHGASSYAKSSARSDQPEGQGTVGVAIREKRAAFSNDLAAEPAVGGERRKEAIALGYRSGISLPLLIENTVVGIFSLVAQEPEFFQDEELKLLNELAGNISFALENIGKDAQLKGHADFDALTGLPTRTWFRDRLAATLQSAKHKGCEVAILVSNAKRFRLINETLGRHMGDAVLQELARRFTQFWPEPDNVAYLAPDSFGGILSVVKGASEVAHLLEKSIMASLGLPFSTGGKDLGISLAVGIAIFPTDGEDADTLLENAEVALRQAKAVGAKYAFYRPKMYATLAEPLQLENKLRTALENQQFELYYQPKIDVLKGKIVGLEALLRWNDPDRGLIPPLQFISILEETGMMLDVGTWALRKAMSDFEQWSIDRLDPPRIAMNISPVQLRQKNFVDLIRNAVKDLKGAPQALDLEITESLIIEDMESNIRNLGILRDMGMRVAIDDFGTGYSSLAFLSRLPVDALKIDCSFIATITQNPDSTAIVSTIISLAHALQLDVIAKCVETDEQSQLLKLLRCDQLQGHLFCKPIPAKAVAELLVKDRPQPLLNATQG